MIQSFEEKLLSYENLIQDKFNVQNPYLLKTGTLGTLINILSQQDIDTYNYYQKVFQEMHPALARDFNSMLFHASFYDVNIELAQPPIYSVYFKVPDINTDNSRYYEYIIDKNTIFTNDLGFKFIIPHKIQIIQTSDQIKAWMYSDTEGKVQLNITSTILQETNGTVYLVKYDFVKQLERQFYKYIVPKYDYGTSYYFDININNYQELNDIRAWVTPNPQETGKYITTNDLEKFDKEDIAYSFGIDEYKIKYFTFGSTRYNKDIFLDIKEKLLTFKTGDGIRGAKLKEGDEIFIELDITKGEKGVLETLSFYVDNITVKNVTLDGKEYFFKTVFNGFASEAGRDSRSVEDVESIKTKIQEQLQTRNSITTLADFERAFTINDSKPFIDSKFIDNKSVVFAFNVLKHNSEIVDTTSLNLTEDQISSTPFFPEIDYNGVTVISPFYYKRKNENITTAYQVIPSIEVNLYISSSINQLLALDNDIDLRIEYDFGKRKSYLRLYNTKDDYTYQLRCNQFTCTFNFGNGFTYEVNEMYTDTFCIVKEPIFDFEVDIINDNGQLLFTRFNYRSPDTEYYQLRKSQEIYKYYLQIDPPDFNISDVGTSATIDYLQDELEDILSTVEELYYPIQQGELPYLLRLPFVSKDFFDSLSYQSFFDLIDTFFNITSNEDKFGLTSRVQQSFYDTIAINTKYLPYIFKQNYSNITTPKIPVIVQMTIDRQNLELSIYDTQSDLEFDITIKIIRFLSEKEGFQISFFESELENSILNEINVDREILKNFNIVAPRQFVVNDPDIIYYNLGKDMSATDIVNFIPPYFHFDYNNIIIDTTIY